MKEIYLGRDEATGESIYEIIQSYRRADGTPTRAHRKVIGLEAKAKAIIELKALTGSIGSLAVPFSVGVALTTQKNGGAGMPSVYKRIDTELGRYPVDDKFLNRFSSFITKLETSGAAVNTVNNHKRAVQHTLNIMYQEGQIKETPLRKLVVKQKFRARIWSQAERTRIYKQLNDLNSHLYWSVYFAEKNPIRCRSDLWQLPREALVEAGKNAPYVRFWPKKTESRKPRECTLMNIDSELLNYWRWLFRTFPDCDLLFPHVLSRVPRGKTTPEVYGWEPMGNPRRHWEYICEKAKVEDFHFHDLRHVAITYMLKQGWSREQLKKLGVQHTDRAIDVYDHTDADDVLEMGPVAGANSQVAQFVRRANGF